MSTRPRQQRPSLALPGPAGLPPDALAGVYSAWSDPGWPEHVAEETSAQRDAQWQEWCAAQVAAGAEVTDGVALDPFVVSSAQAHWDRLQTAAAERVRAQAASRPAAEAAAAEQRAATAAFAAWLAAADGATRARVASARAQHAALADARARLEAVRTAQAAVGAAQAAQLRQVAALAVAYHAATLPADAPPELHISLGGHADPVDLAAVGGVHELVAELAPALGWAPGTTARRVRLAPRVVALMPHAMARLDAGQLDLDRALLAAGACASASAAVTTAVDADLFAPGGSATTASGALMSTTALRAEAERALGLRDPASVAERARRRTTARAVSLVPLADGMARLEVTAPAVALVPAFGHLTDVAAANRAEAAAAARAGRVAADGGDPYADPGDGADPDVPAADRRTLNAHRADAAVAALSGTRPAAPGSARPRPGVELHVSVLALAGLSDDPAHLEGYGPVPAWHARATTGWAGTLVRRVLADPFTGDVLAVDGHVYPASWLRDVVRRSQHDPDDGPPPGSPPDDGGPPAPGPPGRPSPGRGDPGGAAFFRGLPVQHPPAPADLADPLPADAVEDQLAARDAALRATGHHTADPFGDHVGDPCADGTCTPLDPADCPLAAVGGGPYVPGAAQARHIRRLWGGCTGPGSTARAARTDLDHFVPYRPGDPGGGPTCGCNLEPKSRFWHLTKSATDPTTWTNPADPAALDVPWTRRWDQWRCSQGSAHYRSPLGVAHHTRPRPVAEPAGPFRRTHPVTVTEVALRPDAPGSPGTGHAPVVFPDEPGF